MSLVPSIWNGMPATGAHAVVTLERFTGLVRSMAKLIWVMVCSATVASGFAGFGFCALTAYVWSDE